MYTFILLHGSFDLWRASKTTQEDNMEDIKTSLDKILAKFNDSVTHSAPKKLSFEHLGDSFNDSGTIPKKRRFSQSFDDDNSSNVSHNPTNLSSNSSVAIPPSPWEARRMKADLIEAKTRVTKFKQEVERLHKLRQETEILYENRVSELKKQCDFSSVKIQDLEKHMQVLRKREYAAKQEMLKVQNDVQQQKHGYEEIISKLQKGKHEAEENARIIQNSMTNELNDYKRHAEKLELDLELSVDELESVRNQLDDYKLKVSAYDDLKLQHEQVTQDLLYANQRIKELEFEIASYNDWKEITKNCQTRLLSIPDMDKEMDRLRSNNKNLQELLGNKLLLEEQVYDLRSRLDKEEGAKSEAVALQVQLKHVQDELKEWTKVGQDHCPQNTFVNPMALRARIEELLQHDVLMVSEKNSKVSESKTLENELLEYKEKCEIYLKDLEELNTELKRYKAFKGRVQKKLLLVSKERDCYKQLLENFEKDLTISNTGSSTDQSSTENQLKMRVEMLEKTLVGYKDMCSSLEKELTIAKSTPNGDQILDEGSSNVLVGSSAGYEHFKKELDILRIENERLRRRKEELELELEHRCLKGDFNIEKYKVVHLKLNPASEAYENADNIIEKLQAEIERLKRKNKKLEDDNEVTQARFNDTTGMTMNMKEINQLRSELESMNSKMKKIKDCYKSASLEFREVVYMLFGYRIDRIGANTNYKISSMYAESPDHYLNFRLNESNVLDMLETPYSATLKPLIETQLVGNKSLPAFLSALTLDLFQKTTIMIT